MVKSAQEAAGIAPEELAKYEPVIGSRGRRCSAWGPGRRFTAFTTGNYSRSPTAMGLLP
jgi:hypothetical protein